MIMPPASRDGHAFAVLQPFHKKHPYGYGCGKKQSGKQWGEAQQCIKSQGTQVYVVNQNGFCDFMEECIGKSACQCPRKNVIRIGFPFPQCADNRAGAVACQTEAHTKNQAAHDNAGMEGEDGNGTDAELMECIDADH